jgi:hypothetical protein
MALMTTTLAKQNIRGASEYYSADDAAELNTGNKIDKELKSFIRKTVNKGFRGLGYKRGSKPALFGSIDLKKDEKGYYVKDVYCNILVRHGVGPRNQPNNNVMNVEHTWPQSKGAKREPFRGDLHHLFPTDSRANSTRGNFPLGEVHNPEDATSNCSSSQKGKLIHPITKKSTSTRGFQPPEGHRGNAARAMFYSAIFYGHQISEMEEYYLRKWHNEDPVDQDEIERNNNVEKFQGNRNPFIDYPSLADRIKDL